METGSTVLLAAAIFQVSYVGWRPDNLKGQGPEHAPHTVSSYPLHPPELPLVIHTRDNAITSMAGLFYYWTRVLPAAPIGISRGVCASPELIHDETCSPGVAVRKWTSGFGRKIGQGLLEEQS